ncbi:MAG: HD domain-containing protein [Candidatus Pacebacteria bacterium]|nr:HD domain-containing protein [Candidatus Paceibacterota bacterium]
MSTIFNIPSEVTRVTETLKNAGFEAYLVGGCVRDLIVGKEPKDWDVTTNAHPDQIQALFEETYYNNDYGTVGVVNESTQDQKLKVVEVTPYRTEGEYTNKRHPDTVTFGVTLEEDLARRDFTVNAIALDPFKGQMVDPYKGQADIAGKLLRAVGDAGERFREDALRMLRAVRLGAELGFGIDQQTYVALSENAYLLANISKERIRDELIKIIMSPRPMEGLLHMKHTGLLHYVIPDLERAVGVEQNQAHSYHVFEHLLRALQHSAENDWPIEVRLAALFHDISKPECRRKAPNGEWTFYGHEVVGSRVTRKALSDLKFSKEIVEKVVKMVRWHMFFSDPDQITLSAVRRMIVNVGGDDSIWHLLNVRKCDRIGSGRPKEQPFRFRKYVSMVEEALRDPISVGMLKVDGKHLMSVTHETPGPRIGNMLHALLEEVLEDPSKNTVEYMEKRAKELSALSDQELLALGKQGKERKDEEEEKEIEGLRKKHHVN